MSIIRDFRVSPMITSNGMVASLIGVAPEDQIKISGKMPAVNHVPVTAELQSISISASAAVSLGYAGLVDFNSGASGLYFLMDMVALYPPLSGLPGSVIAKEYYGFGVRICVKAWDVSASIGSNIGMLAASCTAKGGMSSMAIDTVGIDVKDMAEMMPLLGSNLGSFTEDTLAQLSVFNNALGTFIKNDIKKISPQLLAVDLNGSMLSLPYDQSPSTVYGLHGIDDGLSYKRALEKKPSSGKASEIDDSVVYEIYQAIVGDNKDQKPDDPQKKQAHKAVFHKE